MFQNQVEVDGGKSLDLSNYPCIFMVFWPPLTASVSVSINIIIFLRPSVMVSLQRWKEQYFVNVGTDCGLTIAGFYYVCFSCSDGSINGFYYDPNSRYESWLYRSNTAFLCFGNVVHKLLLEICSPFQKLELKSTNEGRSGFSFSSYELQWT